MRYTDNGTTNPKLICPLGGHLQHYWDRLSDREKLMRMDEEGLFSLALETVALEIAERTPGEVVLDAFCGVGGMTIGFARTGKKVIAVDNDRKRLEMAKYNAGIFGVGDKIEFIYGDCKVVFSTLVPDTVFLDPPWGGTDYNQVSKFSLSDFEPDGSELLNMAFELSDSVVMRLPKNFDFEELKDINRSFEISRNTLNGKLLHYCVYFI